MFHLSTDVASERPRYDADSQVSGLADDCLWCDCRRFHDCSDGQKSVQEWRGGTEVWDMRGTCGTVIVNQRIRYIQIEAFVCRIEGACICMFGALF